MAQAINKFCPRSGKPIAQDSLTTYKGHIVGFCNSDCRESFASDINGNPNDTNSFDTIIKDNKL
ncbi:MAG TPA: YHS domain-containing protein [Porticoccaceae bacterium]|jgi:hypothetical protein|nr:YHS domain-containing protein [Porticoccaceae bacterium]